MQLPLHTLQLLSALRNKNNTYATQAMALPRRTLSAFPDTLQYKTKKVIQNIVIVTAHPLSIKAQEIVQSCQRRNCRDTILLSAVWNGNMNSLNEPYDGRGTHTPITATRKNMPGKPYPQPYRTHTNFISGLRHNIINVTIIDASDATAAAHSLSVALAI